MTLINCTYIIIFFLLFSPNSAAKKRCKPLLEKLHNIQSMQRNGYSYKRGLSLRSREDKARENWWQCEQGRGKNTLKAKSKNKKTTSYKANSKNIKRREIKAGTPFKTNNAIMFNSKYQGDEKRAWLRYYQQPRQCQQPKSLAVFASCSENKQKQRRDFEQGYDGL